MNASAQVHAAKVLEVIESKALLSLVSDLPAKELCEFCKMNHLYPNGRWDCVFCGELYHGEAAEFPSESADYHDCHFNEAGFLATYE